MPEDGAVLPLLAVQEETARSVLPPDVWAYFAGGAGGQRSAGEAVAAWERVRLRPRVLRDVSAVDPATRVLGTPVAAPLLVGPTALHTLAHPEGEVATARAARAAGSLLVVSTRCGMPLEQVAAAAGPWWLQVYVLRDRGLTAALVQRAVAAGARALVLTGDTPYLGVRRSGPLPAAAGTAYLANLEQHLGAGARVAEVTAQDPSVGLDAIGWLAGVSGLPVLVKGVLRGDDARDCLAAGAAGVVVSNHGGRQLDGAVPTARALPEVVAAVGDAAEVYVDGGLRDGPTVLAALAMGARAVLLGRPVLWALAAGGAAGVGALLDGLREDLVAALALAGMPTIDAVDASLLAPGPAALG